MAIKYLNVDITGKKATYLTHQGDIVCGNSDYRVRFNFDSEWDGYDEKVARFIWGGHFVDVEFTGDEVDVPVISGATRVKVGVYTTGDGLCTTTSAVISCTPSILCESGQASQENDQRYLNEAREILKQCMDILEEVQGSGGGGGASVEVLQDTGSRTDAVMSQAATTVALATKLDARKNSNKEYPELYQVSTKGDQGARVLQSIWQDDETALIAYSAVQRDQNGCVQVGTPKKKVDATSKKYVDSVYRHDIVFSEGLDYDGTVGYIACSVYSRSQEAWEYDGYNCTLVGRATASGFINIEGIRYQVVGLEKGTNYVSYFIYYADETGAVARFDFYDGTGTFTDTVTQMI